MENEEIMFSPQEEKEFRNKAKKRIACKIHGMIYFLTCLLLWLFWLFIFKGSIDRSTPILKFCIFVTLVWGICVLLHYLFVYKWNKSYLEKEIKRLKKEKEKERKQLEELNQISYNN